MTDCRTCNEKVKCINGFIRQHQEVTEDFFIDDLVTIKDNSFSMCYDKVSMIMYHEDDSNKIKKTTFKVIGIGGEYPTSNPHDYFCPLEIGFNSIKLVNVKDFDHIVFTRPAFIQKVVIDPKFKEYTENWLRMIQSEIKTDPNRKIYCIKALRKWYEAHNLWLGLREAKEEVDRLMAT